jgi:hypothetical protein
MVERAFTLRTDLFEATTPGPHFINPRCFGEDFASWLHTRLKAQNLPSSAPIAEDWGWALVVLYRDRKYTLAIGIMDDSIGRRLAEWRIGVAFERPLNSVRSWFAAAPKADLDALAEVVKAVLESEPRIAAVVRV